MYARYPLLEKIVVKHVAVLNGIEKNETAHLKKGANSLHFNALFFTVCMPLNSLPHHHEGIPFNPGFREGAID